MPSGKHVEHVFKVTFECVDSRLRGPEYFQARRERIKELEAYAREAGKNVVYHHIVVSTPGGEVTESSRGLLGYELKRRIGMIQKAAQRHNQTVSYSISAAVHGHGDMIVENEEIAPGETVPRLKQDSKSKAACGAMGFGPWYEEMIRIFMAQKKVWSPKQGEFMKITGRTYHEKRHRIEQILADHYTSGDLQTLQWIGRERKDVVTNTQKQVAVAEDFFREFRRTLSAGTDCNYHVHGAIVGHDYSYHPVTEGAGTSLHAAFYGKARHLYDSNRARLSRAELEKLESDRFGGQKPTKYLFMHPGLISATATLEHHNSRTDEEQIRVAPGEAFFGTPNMAHGAIGFSMMLLAAYQAHLQDPHHGERGHDWTGAKIQPILVLPKRMRKFEAKFRKGLESDPILRLISSKGGTIGALKIIRGKSWTPYNAGLYPRPKRKLVAAKK